MRKHGRRIVSFLLALVMTLSLGSGVWAENDEGGQEGGTGGKTSPGASITVNGTSVEFYASIESGYLSYKDGDAKVRAESSITIGEGDNAVAMPSFFYYRTGGFKFALGIGTYSESSNRPTLSVDNSNVASVSDPTCDDRNNQYTYLVSIAEGEGQSVSKDDTIIFTLGEGDDEQKFAVVFTQESFSAKNELTGHQSAIGFAETYLEDSTGKLKSDDILSDAIEAFRKVDSDDPDNDRDALGNMQIPVDGGGKMEFGRYLAELAASNGMTLFDHGEGAVSGYGVGKELTVNNHKIKFLSGMEWGVPVYNDSWGITATDGTGYTIATAPESFMLAIDAGAESDWDWDKQDSLRPTLTVTDITADINNDGISVIDQRVMCFYRISNFAVPASGTTLTFTVKYSETDSITFTVKFEGYSIAKSLNNNQDADNTAKTYAEAYLVDSTGRVKASDTDTSGIGFKESYTDTEIAKIKAAIQAFRGLLDNPRDELGNTDILLNDNGEKIQFGQYLAMLSGVAGIGLWGDDWKTGFDAGVTMTLDTTHTVRYATETAWGVPSYDPSENVKADKDSKTFTANWGVEGFTLIVSCAENEAAPTLTAPDGVTIEHRDNEYMDVDGKRLYYYRVDCGRNETERELTFTLTYVGESSGTEIKVKLVEPICDHTFGAGTVPTNPSDVLKICYDKGYTYPDIVKDLHFAFPEELKEWTENCGDDWDYRLIEDKTTGNITVQVNYGSAARWEAAARSALEDSFLADGVYFRYWFGGSSEVKSTKYGMELYGSFSLMSSTEIAGFGTTLESTKLMSDYYFGNGLDMAVLNKQSDTSSMLTLSEKEVWIVIIAMDNENGADKTMTNAAYRYALTITVEPTASMAVMLEDTGLPKVGTGRITVAIEDSKKDIWTDVVAQEVADSVFLHAENYENQPYGEKIATMTVKAPVGYEYEFVSWKADAMDQNDDTAKNEIPLYNVEVNIVTLTWKNTTTDETMQEVVVVETGSTQNWMDLLAKNGISVNKPDSVLTDAEDGKLSSNGIYVEYDETYGYFHTATNAGELTDVQYLNAGVDIEVPADLAGKAVYYRVLKPAGSDNPTATDKEHGTNQASYFTAAKEYTVGSDPDGVLHHDFVQIGELKVNGLTVYYAEDQVYHITLVQWLDENKDVIGYSYVYGRNSDFVTAVETDVKSNVTGEVKNPTLEWVGEDPGFTCDKNPQTGGEGANGNKVFFRFEVKEKEECPEGGWVIYLPYDYFGIDKAEGLKRARNGEHPTVYHYLDESCTGEPEILIGEYTEYGVRFTTKSFSPFVVDCSKTTTTTYYYPSYSSVTDKAKAPDTGDAGIALYAVMAVMSVTGSAVVVRRKKK